MGPRRRALLALCLVAGGLQLGVAAPDAEAAVGARDPSYGTSGERYVDVGVGQTVPLGSRLLAGGGALTIAYEDQRADTTPPTTSGILSVTRLRSDGTPDPAFGTAGTARTTLAGVGRAETVEYGDVLADGDATVVALKSYDTPGGWRSRLVRLLPDGSPDPSFGTGGVVVLPDRGSNPAEIWDAVVRQDGTVVTVSTYHGELVLVAIDRTGELVEAFGDGGSVVVDDYVYYYAHPQLAAAAGDGVHLLMGLDGGDRDEDAQLRVDRRRPDGSLDPTWGIGGETVLPATPWRKDVAVLPDGALLVAHGRAAKVTRLTPAGTVDLAYGIGGTSTPFEQVSYEGYLAAASDGSVAIVSGGASIVGLTPQGTVDARWAAASGAAAFGVAQVLRTPDGGLLVSGRALPSTGSAGHPAPGSLAVRRVAASGALDESYGTEGTTTLRLATGGADSTVSTHVDGLGRAVLVTSSPEGWGITRLTPNGALDPTFGTGGTVRPGGRQPMATIPLADGGIATVAPRDGEVPAHIGYDVRRFDANGAPVASFGVGGLVELPPILLGNHARIAELPLGRLAVALSDRLTVLLPTGAPDPTFGDAGSVPLDHGGTAVSSDGTGVLVAVQHTPAPHAQPRTEVWRFTLLGTRDLAYGTGGAFGLDRQTPLWQLIPAGVLGHYVVHCDRIVRVTLTGQVDPTFQAYDEDPDMPSCGIGTVGNVSADATGRVLYVVERQGRAVIGRLGADGRPDPTFGDGHGVVSVDAGNAYRAVAAPGRILLLGWSRDDGWVMALRDGEPPSMPVLSLSTASVSVTEGESVSLQLRLDRPAETTVSYTLELRDATGRIAEDVNVAHVTDWVLRPGDVTRDLSITPREDFLAEGTERYTLRIVDASYARIGGAPATVSVLDDDPAGDVPGAVGAGLWNADTEFVMWIEPTRPGASTPTTLSAIVTDGNRLVSWTNVAAPYGSVLLPRPPAGKTFKVQAVAWNAHGPSAPSRAFTYAAPQVTVRPPDGAVPVAASVAGVGVSVRWQTRHPLDDLTPVAYSIAVVPTAGGAAVRWVHLDPQSEGTVLRGLPTDEPLTLHLVSWYPSGPVVSSVPVPTSQPPVIEWRDAQPVRLELARRGATPALMWDIAPSHTGQLPIEGISVVVQRGGTVVSTRTYGAATRAASLVPSEIRDGATVTVISWLATGPVASEEIPAAYL